jgi:hypothetical protein
VPDFPHLRLAYIGKSRAVFGQWRGSDPEVVRIKANRVQHAATLRGILEGIEGQSRVISEGRQLAGLPPIPAGAGFLLRLPERANADIIAHALGVELVAEAEGGFILVATEDLTFAKIRNVLAAFEANLDGGGTAASVLEVFSDGADHRRISRILNKDVLALWPFADDTNYTFDLSIQTAASLRSVTFPKVRRKAGETAEDHIARKRSIRDALLAEACDAWTDAAEERFRELLVLIHHYDGSLVDGMANAPEQVAERGVIFADCFQVRIRMSGRGFKDVVLNSPHLFEVAIPEEASVPVTETGPGEFQQLELAAPGAAAPAVCIIDSGIEEGHLWLTQAIDRASSRSFLPAGPADAVQDEVRSAGHGTRVAGTILYPTSVPRAGRVQAIAWIQNARVLDAACEVPDGLSQPRYLQDVVKHFSASEKATKLYNHSIGSRAACAVGRMSASAAKMDELSALNDVMFIQAAGNLKRTNPDLMNPGIYEHLQSNRVYPAYLLEETSRICDPAQSLQALTVGSVAGAVFSDVDRKSFADDPSQVSSFSRTGFGMWNAVKPEVVEIGGDLLTSRVGVSIPAPHPDVSLELPCATHAGAAPVAKDGIGTSFAAPKVARIAAQLQVLFPAASPLLFRALIVQSANWPAWAEAEADKDQVLRLIGYGRPDELRATSNTESRVTLITADAVAIRNQELHLYKVIIPAGIRNLAADTQIRMEVTLSYSSEPRRTRRSRNGYLRTWLDWRSSGLDEPFDVFVARMTGTALQRRRNYIQPPWTLHYVNQHGEAEDTHRGRGTVQKDWATVDAHRLPVELGFAVRAHPGWDHRLEEGLAKYCLVVSFEAVGAELPIYALISEAQAEVQAEVPAEVNVL